MNRLVRGLVPVGFAVLAVAACSSPDAGEVVVRIDGSVSSLVTTIPEQTTTTVAGVQTTTSLPGLDPGACPAPGEVVVIALSDSAQNPDPCPLSTDGTIRFSNLTDAEITVQWAGRDLRIAAQTSVTPPEPVSEVLSPGLHAFETSLNLTPTVIVSSPDSGFGSARVGLRTFGGLRPGDPITVAADAIGSGIVVADRTGTCSIGWVAGDPHSPVIGLDTTAEDPVILRVDATTANQRTLSEVGIGSTVGDLQDAYGTQLGQSTESQYTFQPNESIDANFRLVFDVEAVDGVETVTAMRIGRLGEVERDTPCP